jgi:hypothetical protein
MNPADFVPVYDETVREIKGNQEWPIQGYPYCLQLPSAIVLATFFDPAPSIVMMPPLSQAAGSPYGFNHLVPWFKFPDGTLRNAARLAFYWGMPGVPPAQALDLAKNDLKVTVEGVTGL